MIGGSPTGPNHPAGTPGGGGGGIPSQHLKINIYECTGTGPRGRATHVTRYKLGADRRYFHHTTVKGYPNNALLARSVPAGVAQVVAQITANPGRFCLIGTSQGAVIMSEVFRLLSTGAIPGRMDDCVGIFLLGNGLREAGRAFPGCVPIPGGHGIASASRRLVDTPELVWEFANEGDPICTVGDSPAEQTMTALMELLLGGRPPMIRISVGLQAIFQLFSGLKSCHNVYSADDWKPSGADPRSGVRIILDRLNTEIGPQHEFDYPVRAGESP